MQRLWRKLDIRQRRVAALIRTGNQARDRRDWPMAATSYAAALALDPGRAPIRIQQGHALREMGDHTGALAAYRAAAALAPESADAALHLGHLLGLQGERREGLALLRAALHRAGADPLLSAAIAELSRLEFNAAWHAAEAALARHDRAEAASHYLAALAEVPSEAVVLAGLAERLHETGSKDAAAAACRRALSLSPNLPQAETVLALLERDEGKLEAAFARLDATLKRQHANPRAWAAMRDLRAELNLGIRRLIAAERGVRAEDLPAAFDFVCFGTTGSCNASCIHCPTNKPETAEAPRHPMPMPLFEGILRQMAEHHFSIRGQISLGLWGDGLVDPLVVERARLVRALFPEALVSVNTNGAAYNPRRHKALFDSVTQIAVHLESLVPEVYAELMAPLRLERVLPKIEAILRDFPGKVYVSVPVSRLNLAELPAIRAWFLERGANGVAFDGLASRCSRDRTTFDRISLGASPIRCRPEQVSDCLIVDCDGTVTICCMDFERREPVGNLARDSLIDTLLSPARREVLDLFAAGRHAERESCRLCYGDPQTVVA
ncbi:radical SAM/SPASM domain-containing protein [Falsiroseomonas tokyonensis]|uniref:Tetratricopeptide repeat protein n=1 Tax=Falsiroseomonas tokyonensis TaxID=430521 RepID=A0ABV7BUD6_9PROT|nr:radical SAM/SPASM domain-containing protein [Falsiroseomonas tokyonensis]MBU8538242.1 tetratricopeptide repeat protein [Falsiroseomonas tokyonensis]